MQNVCSLSYDEEKGLEKTKTRRINRILNLIKKHKLISIIITTFLTLSVMNFYLIFSFMRILQNI